MRNTLINPPYSVDPSDNLVNDVLLLLESKHGFNSDSDTGVDLIQRFRELTLNDEYSSRDILFKLLSQYNQSLNKLLDKHEQSETEVVKRNLKTRTIN